jgi:anti-sigma28 factor (negative regulator of flagellin synthesis)
MEKPPEKGRYAMVTMSQISTAAYGVNSYGQASNTPAKKSASQGSQASGSANVQLSDTSVTMSKLRSAIDSMDDVRTPIVDAIKQKIQEDGYPIETSLYKAVSKMVDNNVV